MMLLFRVGDSTRGNQERGEPARTTPRLPGLNESQGEEGDAAIAFSPIANDKGNQQHAISCPQVSDANAMLQIPSIAKVDAPDSHGGSMFHEGADSRNIP